MSVNGVVDRESGNSKEKTKEKGLFGFVGMLANVPFLHVPKSNRRETLGAGELPNGLAPAVLVPKNAIPLRPPYQSKLRASSRCRPVTVHGRTSCVRLPRGGFPEQPGERWSCLNRCRSI